MSDSTLDALFAAARIARERAYAPYSNFQVGAAILSESGKIYTGCNVENSAYPVGTCAEAGAIAAMVAAGEQKIMSIAVVGSSSKLCPPCGACRQRIAEFSVSETGVYLSKDNGNSVQRFSVEFMLPLGFDARNM